jgi:hypothetical protein
VTEERPASGDETPPPEPTTERTPSWPRRAAKVAAGAAWEDLSDTSRRLIDTGRFRATGAWQRRPSRGALTARGFLLAAALAGAVSLLAQTRLPGLLPSELDWSAAAALLERDSRTGDAVVVAPAWAERARAELPARVPVFSLAQYAREPLLGVRRAWLLSLSGAPFSGERVARDVAARASSHGGPQQIGNLTITRYDLAQPSRAIAFLPDWLGQATALLGARPCERDGPFALRCPGDDSIRIAREIRELGGAPRACISTFPGSAATGPVTLTFPSVPMGLQLRGGAGVIGRLPSEATSAIRVAVQVDGEEVAAVELPPGAPAWKRFEIPTGSLAAEPHAVSVILSSPDPEGRKVCLDLWTLP